MFKLIASIVSLGVLFANARPRTPNEIALSRWSPATTGDSDKDRFIRSIWPMARTVAARFGLHPAVLIAQAALESGWGRSGSMVRGNALWGVKVGSYTPAEARVRALRIRAESGLAVRPFTATTWNTHEESAAGRTSQSDQFRVYPDLLSGAADYADAVTRGRYAATKQTLDPYVQLGIIWGAGYATSRRYIQSVASILRTIGAGSMPEWIDGYQEEILALRDADNSTSGAIARLIEEHGR